MKTGKHHIIHILKYKATCKIQHFMLWIHKVSYVSQGENIQVLDKENKKCKISEVNN